MALALDSRRQSARESGASRASDRRASITPWMPREGYDPDQMKHLPGLLVVAGLVAATFGCRSHPKSASAPCGAKEDVQQAGRTGVAGAKTGVTTGVEGVKAFGDATAGLVEGGSDEAAARWREGKDKTKATAREGKAATKSEAHSEPCTK